MILLFLKSRLNLDCSALRVNSMEYWNIIDVFCFFDWIAVLIYGLINKSNPNCEWLQSYLHGPQKCSFTARNILQIDNI